MNDGYIAVIDSGIGGLSVLYELIKEMPNEKFIYYGDNNNAPYGNRTKRDLLGLTTDIIVKLSRFKLKGVVLACNTLSTSILTDLNERFLNLKIFGVFPPVEILTLRKRKTLLLCTPNTSRLYKNSEYLTVLPMQGLASDIEKNAFNLDAVDFSKHVISCCDALNSSLTTFDTTLTTTSKNCLPKLQKGSFEVVVLGCTHYFFIKNKIFNHFQPQMIVRGETFTAKKVGRELKHIKSLVKTKGNNILYYGDCAITNKKIFDLLINNSVKNLKKLQKN